MRLVDHKLRGRPVGEALTQTVGRSVPSRRLAGTDARDPTVGTAAPFWTATGGAPVGSSAVILNPCALECAPAGTAGSPARNAGSHAGSNTTMATLVMAHMRAAKLRRILREPRTHTQNRC
eukprot:scaffold9331_cov116-Isochrysis_galbana.AAC.8